MMVFFRAALTAVAVLCVAQPAMAAQIADGTVSFVDLGQPTVDYTGDPSTVTFAGGTFQVNATGGFAGAKNGAGAMAGTLAFSAVEGESRAETLGDFFTFSDGAGGSFAFSVDSVLTKSYAVATGSQSFSLFLLGTTANSLANMSATPTSLTLTFNQTGGSGYTASGTLAAPAPVPEPASWAMFIGGFGMIGAAMRRRSVTVRFA